MKPLLTAAQQEVLGMVFVASENREVALFDGEDLDRARELAALGLILVADTDDDTGDCFELPW